MRPGRANPVLLAIVVEGFLSRLSFGLISFALPLYAYRLGMSLTAIGFLSSLNLVVALLLKPASGSAVDRVGLKLGLLASMTLRSLVSLLLAFATLPWQLFATRAVHGVSISVRDPAVNALIAEHGGKQSIASAFAWYQTAKSVAGALGKVLAGLLLGLTASNFSLVFGVAFALSALPIAIVALYLPKDLRSPAVEVGPATQPDEPEPEAPRPAMLPFMSLGFLVSGTAYMLANLFPIFAVEYAGLTEAQAGLIYSLSAIVVLAGPIFGWLSDHVSRKLVLSIRSAANVLSSVVYLVAPNLAGMAAGRIVDDLGKAAFRPGWGALMAHVSSFDKRRRGRTMGYLSAGEDAGEVTGPILAGFLWSTWGVPALLGVRIAFAVVTEVYTMTLTRSLHRLEVEATGAAPAAAAAGRRAEPGRRRLARVASAWRDGTGAAPRHEPAAVRVESGRLTSAEVGSRVGTILAAAEETARRIVANARAEAEDVRAKADAYAEKRRRDAADTAAQVTVRAAAEARALEQWSADSHSRLEAEVARHEELLRLSQDVQEEIRRTISSGQEAVDRLETIVEEATHAPDESLVEPRA